MYTIKYYDDYIYIPGDDEICVLEPWMENEVSKAGKLNFTILDTHPLFGEIQKLKWGLTVEKNGKTIFRGRTIDTEQDFDKKIHYSAEGKLAALNDSLCRPFEFKGTPEELFAYLIDNHNNQVGPEQSFKLGNVTVTDPNDYISRSSEKTETTKNIIKSRLVEPLGGFLVVRYEEDGDYIDWISQSDVYSKQKVEFGENLLDLNMFIDATSTYTACIPYGAKGEDGNLLTVAEVNEGNDYVINEALELEYGRIFAPAEKTTWEDITTANGLLQKAEEWLNNEGVMFVSSLELSFLDLSKLGFDMDEIELYENVEVISEPHGLRTSFFVEHMGIDPSNPETLVVTIGKSLNTLVDKTLGEKRKNDNAIQRIEVIENQSADYVTNEKFTEVINETNNKLDFNTLDLQKIIAEQSTEITQNCNDIILSALQAYTQTGSFEEFKTSVETALKVHADNLTVNVSRITSEINSINNDLQQKFNQVTKYFTFDINGLTIGEVDNPNRVVIDNDEISILVNGGVVQTFDAQGKALIPELNITREFDLFGYVINEDEDSRVNCDYAG